MRAGAELVLFPGLSDTYPFSSTRAFALWPSSLYGGTEYREKGLRLEVGQRMDVAGLLESPDSFGWSSALCLAVAYSVHPRRPLAGRSVQSGWYGGHA